MARHGENIRRRKDGRWEGRYPVYSEEKGKKEYRSVYGRTYEAVKEKLTEEKIRLKEMKKGMDWKEKKENFGSKKVIINKTCLEPTKNLFVETICEKTMTDSEEKTVERRLTEFQFAEMAEEWLQEVRNKKKWSTYIKYRCVYSNYLKTSLQNVSLAKLPEILEEGKSFLFLSESIRKSIYCVLNQILKFASDQYSTMASVLKRPSLHIQKKPVEIFCKKDQAKLFSILYQKTDHYKMAILLCLHTGLRLGEVCALKWEDVDFENGLLMVKRTVQRIYAEGYPTKTILMETAPKSEHSCREIPLSASVLKLLVLFKNQQTYIFGGKKPLEPRTLQNQFKKILKEAGAANKNFHALRHTFSTNCIEGGTDVKSLSEMLGHSDVQITLNQYVHPSMDTKRRYIDSLSAFYGQIHGHIDC